MIPESKYIKNELTLRDMALPDEVKLTRKSLVRWLALSLGLISPNESRMLMLDLLDVLFYFHVKQESPTTQRILDRLEEVTGEKPNPKAVYYHLLKLKENGHGCRSISAPFTPSGPMRHLRKSTRRSPNWSRPTNAEEGDLKPLSPNLWM
jgi:hypothetical protein